MAEKVVGRESKSDRGDRNRQWTPSPPPPDAISPAKTQPPPWSSAPSAADLQEPQNLYWENNASHCLEFGVGGVVCTESENYLHPKQTFLSVLPSSLYVFLGFLLGFEIEREEMGFVVLWNCGRESFWGSYPKAELGMEACGSYEWEGRVTYIQCQDFYFGKYLFVLRFSILFSL